MTNAPGRASLRALVAMWMALLAPLAWGNADAGRLGQLRGAAVGWFWMLTATLVRGMRTFDTIENRGYVIIEAP
jgi:hypothetical protein